MITTDIVRENLKEILDEAGCFLVDVKVDRNNKIIVHIDRDSGVHIEDCVRISKQLESRIDRDKEDFALEVSSPGLDVPFKVKEQYQKSSGKKIRVLTVDGQTIEGTLNRVNVAGIELEQPGSDETISLSFDDIRSACRIIDF